MQQLFILLLCIACLKASSQDSLYLKVHFLYGSKPLKKYKHTEPKWFGGILGGHVGIESDSNQIINFIPNGKFHWFAHKKEKHSAYTSHNNDAFYSILGYDPDSVKKLIIFIPVSQLQKNQFDSTTKEYLATTPYDYALFGMRCGSAAYERLAQLGFVKKYSYRKTYRKIFYPKKLRKRLLRKAKQNNWRIMFNEGSVKRKWEID